MDLGLKDKVAIITGAGQGIGRDVALLLAAEGANVVINEIDEKSGRDVLKEIEDKTGKKAVLIVGDVSSEEVCNKIVDGALKAFGKLDILINNAGISPKLPFWEITPEQFDKVLAVNTKSAFMLIKAAFEPMRKNGKGSIVSLSSTAGVFGSVNSAAHYSASKGAIFGLTNTMAMQMGPYNINVNCVAPGRIDTAMTKMLTPERLKAVVDRIPLGRLGTTQECANVIVFLASDAASYLSGNCIEITGKYMQSTQA